MTWETPREAVPLRAAQLKAGPRQEFPGGRLASVLAWSRLLARGLVSDGLARGPVPGRPRVCSRSGSPAHPAGRPVAAPGSVRVQRVRCRRRAAGPWPPGQPEQQDRLGDRRRPGRPPRDCSVSSAVRMIGPASVPGRPGSARTARSPQRAACRQVSGGQAVLRVEVSGWRAPASLEIGRQRLAHRDGLRRAVAQLDQVVQPRNRAAAAPGQPFPAFARARPPGRGKAVTCSERSLTAGRSRDTSRTRAQPRARRRRPGRPPPAVPARQRTVVPPPAGA